jgi:CO/xanthine dehydrogenase Mo-binding subunit
MTSPRISVTRRSLLKGMGSLSVSLALPLELHASPAARRLSPAQVDTYLSIAEDGQVTAFFGKMDMGQGVDVSIAQIVAEELDLACSRVSVVMGDTAVTVNQGGASGSTAIERGARPLRRAAAEARRVLMNLASEKLQAPAAELVVSDGRVYRASDPSRHVTYGELIAGRHFDVALRWNGQFGNALDIEGDAPLKTPSAYRVVGQPFPRRDLPEIVFGTRRFIVDVKVPGMWHGRVLRPPVAGAVPTSVDQASIRDIPKVQIVRDGDFIGVVAEREWDAVRAAERLQVTWSRAAPGFPTHERVYEHIRKAPVTRENAGSGFGPPVVPETEGVEAALAGAARTIEAEYEFPFQSHACMAPACAVCDYRGDSATIWTGSQKPHYTAEGVARLLGLAAENVRGIWVPGPGSYGRNDAGDAAMDAALLSKATGRPVRVQGMRHEGHGWDPKAPASVHTARAGFDEHGNVVAFYFRSKGFSAGDVAPNESNPSDTYAGLLTGWPRARVDRFGNPDGRYQFPNMIQYWQTIAPLLDATVSPLRTAHLRDPLGPQLHFASEGFVDEMAAAVNADPIEFRLRYLKEPRDAAVLEAVRERAGWKPRTAGPQRPPQGGIARGRGVAYTRRANSVVAAVAEVEIDLASGRVWPRRFVVAADQGLVVNPLWLRRTIEGNVIHAASRSLFEEVKFSADTVTSVDWLSYPILEMADAPDEIDIVLIDRPELPPYGAGEPSTRTVPPAIANAIFDAIGVRIRRAPFTPERIKAALERLS